MGSPVIQNGFEEKGQLSSRKHLGVGGQWSLSFATKDLEGHGDLLDQSDSIVTVVTKAEKKGILYSKGRSWFGFSISDSGPLADSASHHTEASLNLCCVESCLN